MTLEEIAALAGVSRATVSRVINHQPRVSTETRRRVEDVIRLQGYHPNIAARSLARHRAQTIGLVIPSTMSFSMTAPYYALIMRGVTNVCEEHSYNLMLSPANNFSPERYADVVSSGAVDGLVITTSAVGRPFLAWLHETGFPFVLIGRQNDLPGINRVCADDEHGGMLAASHFLQLGYRRLALIAGPHDHDAGQARARGFIETARSDGALVAAPYVVEAWFNTTGGENGMRQLLRLDPRPEAVFCGADECAIGALHALHAAGLSVPDDVAIVGFDDTPISATVEPPLTTVRQPIERMGQLAASLLLQIIDARQDITSPAPPPQVITLPTELVVRESCGAMRRAAAAAVRQATAAA